MKFSLVVVAYEAEKYIKKCLESCIGQTYKDIEVIVVDDHSPDNTGVIVQDMMKQDARIRYIRHSDNRSALQARKTGLAHATGKYVWFIDSDDTVDKGACGNIKRGILKNNEPDMLSFGSNDYYADGSFKRKFIDWSKDKSLEEWKFDSDYRPYTRATKRSVLEKSFAYIPDDLHVYRHNDFFMFNILKHFIETKAVLNQSLYNYKLSDTSVTAEKTIESISKHVKHVDFLLAEYEVVLNHLKSDGYINDKSYIDRFTKNEKAKMAKYFVNSYSEDPSLYTHALKEMYGISNKLVLSLTTFSKRIETVDVTIKSLKEQSILADKIVLWLDETETSIEKLPGSLLSLQDDVFEIRFCPNYKSYKKLIPTLELHASDTIITFDDDIEYPKDTVEKLYRTYLDNQECVVASYARNINVKDGKLLPYSEWKHIFREQKDKPLINILPIGVGGVLYPSGSLHKDVSRIDDFMKLAPHGDDLWFKCMTLLNNKKVICVNHGYNLSVNQIDGTQDIGLWQTTNEGTDSNYEQLTNIINAYSELQSIIYGSKFLNYKVDINELICVLDELDKIRKENGAKRREIEKLKKGRNIKSVESIDYRKVDMNKMARMNTNSDEQAFDSEWYLDTYPDVALSGLSALDHYRKYGRILGRKKNSTY